MHLKEEDKNIDLLKKYYFFWISVNSFDSPWLNDPKVQ